MFEVRTRSGAAPLVLLAAAGFSFVGLPFGLAAQHTVDPRAHAALEQPR